MSAGRGFRGARRLARGPASAGANALLGAVAAGLLLGGGARAARAERVALTGATVHTVAAGDLSGGMVLVKDGIIERVEPGSAAPPDARVVDLRGLHLYPGMIAANTVLGLTEILSVQGSEDSRETGDLNPDIRADVQFNPDSDLLPVTRANGITSALVVPGGGTIAGSASLLHLDGWTWEDMTVRSPVGLVLRWPAVGRAGRRGRPDARPLEAQLRERDSTVRVMREAFEDARAYGKARDAEREAGVPRHDREVKWDAMDRALRGELPLIVVVPSAAQIRGALRFCDDLGLARVILVSGPDAALESAELARRGIPVILAGTLALPPRRWEPYDAAYDAAARLHAAGVRFCIADGGGGFNAATARNLPYHAAMARAFGLPADEALASVTLSPARILGVGDRLGSIEPGKIADLVVTDGDLLDIPTQVRQVWIAGKPASLETRQTRLFEKYDAKPRGPRARPRAAPASR